jgi:Flp pilus assembly protein TadG
MRNPAPETVMQARRARGAAAVEFAFLITLLLVIVAGIIEFGRTFWYYNALTKGTRDGARFLSLARASPTVALDSNLIQQSKEIVVNAANAANVPGFSTADVAVECDPGCTAPTWVTVRIDAYPVTIGGWIPFFLPTSITTWSATLSPYTSMRYML